MPLRGFILHPTYRIENGRPVVHLYGRLEDGASFLVRDDRPRPHFFVRSADAAAARAAGAAPLAETDLRTMRGEPVLRVEVATPPDAPPLRDRLAARGVAVFEADVRFAMRYLIDHGIRGSVTIDAGGPAEAGAGRGAAPAAGPAAPRVDRVFVNPAVGPGDWSPAASDLRIVAIDLETDARGEQVFSAAIALPAGPGVAPAEEVLIALPPDRVAAGLRGSGLHATTRACGDEKGLLAALRDRLRQIDFDVLTGWNVIDFDLAVLEAAARRLGVPFEIGRTPGALRVVRETSSWGRSRADIAGRVVLDGIDLLKGAFVRLEDYRLDTAARALLGEGKVDVGGGGKPEAIARAFREDLPRFVAYNLADARLVLGILAQARLIDLAIRRSLLTGMPLDRVGASIASFDSLYLGALRRRGQVAPSVGVEAGEVTETLGGAVLEPAPGLYDNVLAFDFKSLYPSLIRTFNIDPVGHVPEGAGGAALGGPPAGEDDLIRAPNGARFRREPGILPGMLAALFPQREAAKRRGDAIGAQAIKILMNSCYGVLATPACRFYSAPVANAITHFGQWALHFARDHVQERGHRVLYGDTDSLFVLSGLPPGSAAAARRLAEDLRDGINRAIGDHIARAFRLESRLEIEFEALFLKYFLPAVRHGTGGARKRYAGLVEKAGGAGEEILYVGMEVVRRDWTEVSKAFQRGLFERLFRGSAKDEVAAYTRGFVADLKAGAHDPLLVYRKALRKGVEAYTATTPPHVKAARKAGLTGGIVEYVMTTDGPEPVAATGHPLDYAHYVDKQIRPIAEQVLPLLGLDFDDLAGGAAQMRLF
jgi:DNA polymerase-2